MRKLKHILVISFIFLTIVSCKIHEPIIGKPTNYKIEKLDLKAVKICVWLPIENPNNFKFKVKKVDMDLSVNGVYLGKVKQLEKVQIPANSNNTYAIRFEIETKELGLKAMSLVSGLSSGRAQLKLDGSVTVSSFILQKKVNFVTEESIKIW